MLSNVRVMCTDPYSQVSAMLTALNLSYLLENFKAAIIQVVM